MEHNICKLIHLHFYYNHLYIHILFTYYINYSIKSYFLQDRIMLFTYLIFYFYNFHSFSFQLPFLILNISFALSERVSFLFSSGLSIASRCKHGISVLATRPISASLSSCSLSRSSPAIPGCRPLHSPSLSGHFCPDCGKSVLSASAPYQTGDGPLSCVFRYQDCNIYE